MGMLGHDCLDFFGPLVHEGVVPLVLGLTLVG
jgi:hypothetical protein